MMANQPEAYGEKLYNAPWLQRLSLVSTAANVWGHLSRICYGSEQRPLASGGSTKLHGERITMYENQLFIPRQRSSRDTLR